MSPQLERPQPPYRQMADHYRARIRSGELRQGDRLPSARRLAVDWGVAHATAAKVLSLLRAEGLVRAEPGASGGTFVDIRQVASTPKDRLDATLSTGEIYPPGESGRITDAGLVEAPADVAEALGVAAGVLVVRRRRVTCRDDVPVSASTSWFAEQAPLLLVAEHIPQGTAVYLASCTGRVLATGRDQYAAGVADAQVATALGVSAGDPVRLGRNWIYDQDGEVVEFGMSVTIAGRWATHEYPISAR